MAYQATAKLLRFLRVNRYWQRTRLTQRCAPAWPGVEALEGRILLSHAHLVPLSSSLSATINYQFDTNNFFDTQEKRDLMQSAADTLLSRIDDDLRAIKPGKRAFFGTADTWTATLNHPETDAPLELEDLTIENNELLIFVGSRSLGARLGVGGSGGFSASGSPQFVATVKARGEAGARRSNPTDIGPWGGSIAFNTDANWHFGSGTAGLSSNESDFLSVAMHELMHVLGFGAARSWTRFVDSTNTQFTGPASIAAYGLGHPPLDADLHHWSKRLTHFSDPVSMSAKLLSGRRVLPTELDFSGLADVGWQIRNLGQIHGLQWRDDNRDGSWDAGEPGLSDWTVFLDEDEDGELDDDELHTVTDQHGHYSFVDLAPRVYTVDDIAKPGWEQTSSAQSYSVTLSPGDIRGAINFGHLQLPVMPDLVGTIQQLRLPDILVPGDKGTAQILVSNIDTEPVRAKVAIGVVGSINDQIGDDDDRWLGVATTKLRLAPSQIAVGQGKKLRIRLQVPDGIQPGTYNIFTMVDVDGVVQERHETDNLTKVGTRDVMLAFGQVGDRTVKRTIVDGVIYRHRGAGNGKIIRGENGQAPSVLINGGDAQSTLKISAPIDIDRRLNNITLNGSGKYVRARDFDIEGDVVVSGTLTLLAAGNIANRSLIFIAGTALNSRSGFSLQARTVRDLRIDSRDLRIKSIKVDDWKDTDEIEDMIVAPSIGTIRSRQDFGASTNLTDFTRKTSLAKIKVKETLNGAVIRSAGSIGNVTTGRMVDTMILAGLTDFVDGLPDQNDFLRNATIRKITITGKRDPVDPEASFLFANSIISASQIGSIRLKQVTADNSDIKFGIVADTLIKSVRRNGNVMFRNARTEGVFDEDLDFVAQVV